LKANTRINDEGIKEKQCTKCGEWFPETTEYFYMRNKSKPEKGYKSEERYNKIIQWITTDYKQFINK